MTNPFGSRAGQSGGQLIPSAGYLLWVGCGDAMPEGVRS